MQRLALCVGIGLALLVAGCTSTEDAPVYMETRYQVRCMGCVPFSPDDPVRTIETLDGETGVEIECAVDGRNRLSFSARSEEYYFALNNAELADESFPGDSCRVRVREGGNTYEGACTTGEPNEDTPCRVDLTVEGDTATGSILCERIPNRANPTQTRFVVAPGARDMPAEFTVNGCKGL